WRELPVLGIVNVSKTSPTNRANDGNMRLNGAKPASAFSASPQGAVWRWASTQVGPVSLAPAIERHRMVGIRRDGDLGQNRRGVSKADFKFLDQHGEYQADFQTIDIGGGPLVTLLDFPSTSPLDFSRAISSSGHRVRVVSRL